MKSNRKKLCLLKLFSSRPRSPCCLSLLSVCLSGLTAELLRGSAHPAQAGAACKTLHYFRITPRLGERHAEFRLLLRGQLLSLALVSTAGPPAAAPSRLRLAGACLPKFLSSGGLVASGAASRGENGARCSPAGWLQVTAALCVHLISSGCGCLQLLASAALPPVALSGASPQPASPLGSALAAGAQSMVLQRRGTSLAGSHGVRSSTKPRRLKDIVYLKINK